MDHQFQKSVQELNLQELSSRLTGMLLSGRVMFKNTKWHFQESGLSLRDLMERLQIETRAIDPINYREYKIQDVKTKHGRKPDPDKQLKIKEKKPKGRPRIRPLIDYNLHPELKRKIGRPKKIIDQNLVVEKRPVGRHRKTKYLFCWATTLFISNTMFMKIIILIGLYRLK
jgi:membrane peptidoglycan carboxypeptidase